MMASPWCILPADSVNILVISLRSISSVTLVQLFHFCGNPHREVRENTLASYWPQTTRTAPIGVTLRWTIAVPASLSTLQGLRETGVSTKQSFKARVGGVAVG